MFDLVVIGMGPAGVAAAEFAARLDLSVAVVERDRVGGESLWTGRVPSTALLASARTAHLMRTAERVGLEPVEPTIDLARVWRRVRAVQAQISADDATPQRFRDVGVQVMQGTARVTAADEVTVTTAGGSVRTLPTRFVLVCTGSRPHRPEIHGLPLHATYTSDDLFELDHPPATLAVIGGGPMGTEIAQAARRLGVQVTLLQRASTLLPREEPTLVARLTSLLRDEGVVIHCSADVRGVRAVADLHVVHAVVGHDGRAIEVPVHGILLATGRTPNIDTLGLEDLGIEIDELGVATDSAGRTTERSVYAVADASSGATAGRVAGDAAAHHALVAVRDMFFPGRGTAGGEVPACVFTDPELARVGLTVEQAESKFGTDTDVWRFDLSHNDRARADGSTEGGLVVVTGKGRIVGAHVLAPNAGEMIHELTSAVSRELRVDELAELAHVHPTIAGSIGQLATEAAHEKAHRLRWLMKRR